MVFTDLALELPLEEYERRGLRIVLGGDPSAVGGGAPRADYLKANSGVMLLRVHEWTAALVRRMLARGGRTRAQRRRHALEIQQHVQNLCNGCIDDQGARRVVSNPRHRRRRGSDGSRRLMRRRVRPRARRCACAAGCPCPCVRAAGCSQRSRAARAAAPREPRPSRRAANPRPAARALRSCVASTEWPARGSLRWQLARHALLERRYLMQGHWEDFHPAIPLELSREAPAAPHAASTTPTPLRRLDAPPLPPLRRKVFGLADVPLAVHFAGCQLCSGKAPEKAGACWPAFRRVLRFAEEQPLRALGVRHARGTNRSAPEDAALEPVSDL